MADLRVTQLPPLLESELEAGDPLLVADVSASESKKITPVALFEGSSKLIADGTIPSTKIAYPLPSGVVDTQAIGDQQVTAAKIAADTITALQVAPDAIGSSELADGSVDNAAILRNAVTGGSLGSLALNTVTAENMGSNSVNANSLADLSVDTAALQQFAVTGGATGKTAANTIDDFNIVPDGIGRIANNSIGTNQIIDRTITSDKIVLGNITPAELAPDLPGSVLAADTITSREIGPDAIEASEISPLAVDRGLDKTSGQIGHTNQITPGTLSGVDYDEFGHITGASAEGILSNELPPATVAEIGGVSIPATSGLAVDSVGRLNHANSVAAATVSGFTFNESGHILNAELLDSDDLPPATAVNLGAVSVPGPTIVVDGTGALAHSASGVTAGQYPLVTVTEEGLVTAGDVLSPSDIPALDASKIISGIFPTDLLANRSVTQQKLADYSVSFIQEDKPTPDPGGNQFHNGCFWFQESTGQLNTWNGNSWRPVARGALASQNLRWGGGIDASTGLVAFLTDFGVTAGLKVGDALPAATNNNGGLYLVVTEPGALIDVDAVRGTSFDAGDWCLSVDLSTGWVRVNTLSDGGGSGGASFLDGLNDVTIDSPAMGQLLAYNSTAAQWENRMAINWDNMALAGPGVVSYATTNGGELIACTEISGGDY